MNASFDLPNFCFAFLDKGFLVSKLSGRQLRLENLSLALFDSAVMLWSVPNVIDIRTKQERTIGSSDTLSVFLFHGNSNTLYDCPLAFCGDLLRTLERNQGELKVVRCFLKSILLSRLVTDSG